MNNNNHDSQDKAIVIAKIKKQSKKLLKLSKESNDSIAVSNLSQAQELLAQVYGYPSWHALQHSQTPTNINSLKCDNNFSFNESNTTEVISQIEVQHFIKDGEIFYIEDNDYVETYFQITKMDRSPSVIISDFRKIQRSLSFYLNMNMHEISILGNNEKRKIPPITKYSLIQTNEKIIDENPLLKKLFSMDVDLQEIAPSFKSVLELYIKIRTKKDVLNCHKDICKTLLNNAQKNSLFLKMQDVMSIETIEKFKKFDNSNHARNTSLCESLIWKKNVASDNLFEMILKWVYLLNYVQKNSVEVKFALTIAENISLNCDFLNQQDEYFEKSFVKSIETTKEFSEEPLMFRYVDNNINSKQNLNYPSLLNGGIYKHDINDGNKMDLKIISGKPGSGKSVVLNNLILSQSLKSDFKEIPTTFILNIGSSYSSYIKILENVYPNDVKNQILEMKLKKSDFVNIFDTALGIREYSDVHNEIIKNALLHLMFKDLSEKGVSDAEDILNGILNGSFIKGSHEQKKYDYDADEDVNNALKSIGYKVQKGTLWWTIVDVLFDNDYYDEAIKAQRHAVPNIYDLVSIIQITIRNNPDVSSLMDFYTRLNSVLQKYPQAGVTNINIQNKKIVLCDMDEISSVDQTEYSGYMAAAIMNLASNYVLGICDDYPNNIYTSEDAKNKKTYQKYYRDVFGDNSVKKQLVIDEFHRFDKKIKQPMNLIVRNSRRNNLSVFLSSQVIESVADYMDFATEVWINNSDNLSDLFKERFEYLNVDFSVHQKSGYIVWKVWKFTASGIKTDIVKVNASTYLSIAIGTSYIDIAIRDALLKKFSYMEYLDKVKKYLDIKGKNLITISRSLQEDNMDERKITNLMIKEIESI